MKVLNLPTQGRHISEMKDGDIAQIIFWNAEVHLGKVVQRFNNGLVTLGKGYGQSWPRFFNSEVGPEFRVQILPKGTQLLIE